jgi:hypothetical protein
MTSAIPELPGWFARLAHPRSRQPLAASARKVPVVIAQSRNLKERLISDGPVVAFRAFSLLDITNEEHNLPIFFLHIHMKTLISCISWTLRTLVE